MRGGRLRAVVVLAAACSVGPQVAATDGRAVTVERQEGPRWQLGDGASTVTYSVDVRRMEAEVYSSADASKVRAGYAGLLGYSVFAYVEGHEGRGATLDIEGPPGWPVMSTLAPRGGTSSLRVRAADFYALADSQIVMGPSVAVVEIPEAGVPLRLLMYAEGPVDTARERLLERRFRQSIADAPPFLRRLGLVDLSRVASTRYSSDFRTGQLVFSRGGLLAAAIDDRIKAETRGARSLRDVLTAMLRDFGPAGRGFAVEQFPAIVHAATGVDVSAIYDAALKPLDP